MTSPPPPKVPLPAWTWTVLVMTFVVLNIALIAAAITVGVMMSDPSSSQLSTERWLDSAASGIFGTFIGLVAGKLS